jgi:hypothetical protein
VNEKIHITKNADQVEKQRHVSAQLMTQLRAFTPPDTGINFTVQPNETSTDASQLAQLNAKVIQRKGFSISDADKERFLASLKNNITAMANDVLSKVGQSASSCPYIAYWFEHYKAQDAAHIKNALIRYVPGLADSKNMEQAIALIAERVKQGLIKNMESGSLEAVPADLPKDLEEKKAVTQVREAPAQLVIQLCSGEDEAPAAVDVFARSDAARGTFLAHRTSVNLDRWLSRLRADRDAKGFHSLTAREKEKFTQRYDEITAFRGPLEAGERRARAIAKRQEIALNDPRDISQVDVHEAQPSIIKDYTHPDTGKAESHFNKPLRELDATAQQGSDITRLYTALLRRPISDAKILWRGSNHLIGGTDPAALIVDKVYKEEGFLSTSVRRAIAEGFGSRLMRITGNHSGRSIVSLGGDDYGGGEEEVLFPAGVSFRFRGLNAGVYDYEQT